jgi:hypothetical protein
MHPRQASLITHATEVAADLTVKQAEEKQALSSGGQAILWKYTDPEGGVFYLEQKRMTGIRSPFNGKTFTPKPERHTPAQVGKEMKEESKAEKTVNASETDPWKA